MSASYWLYWAVLTVVNAGLLAFIILMALRAERLIREARRVVVDRKDASHRNAMKGAWDDCVELAHEHAWLDDEAARSMYRLNPHSVESSWCFPMPQDGHNCTLREGHDGPHLCCDGHTWWRR